uniref:Uncharacterized protein n=1 Tax=Lygus hesperus TaxID=30085 RepID=A0A0A9Y2T6_LYGHE
MCSYALTRLELVERNEYMGWSLTNASAATNDEDHEAKNDDKNTSSSSIASAAAAAATQAATIQLTHFSLDLDVTQRNGQQFSQGALSGSGGVNLSMSSSSSLSGMPSGGALDATTTTSSSMSSSSFIRTARGLQAAETMTYPTVSFDSPPRRFA